MRELDFYVTTKVSARVLIFPWQTTTQHFFLSLQALKTLISLPRQTKSPDNSNVLQVFNNNTYTDFRTASNTS